MPELETLPSTRKEHDLAQSISTPRRNLGGSSTIDTVGLGMLLVLLVPLSLLLQIRLLLLLEALVLLECSEDLLAFEEFGIGFRSALIFQLFVLLAWMLARRFECNTI